MKLSLFTEVTKIGPVLENKENPNFSKKIINFSSLETKKILAVQVPKYLFEKTKDLLIGSAVKIEVSIEYFTAKDDKSIIYNYFQLTSIKIL